MLSTYKGKLQGWQEQSMPRRTLKNIPHLDDRKYDRRIKVMSPKELAIANIVEQRKGYGRRRIDQCTTTCQCGGADNDRT